MPPQMFFFGWSHQIYEVVYFCCLFARVLWGSTILPKTLYNPKEEENEYTLRQTNIAMENGPFVFPIENGDIPLLC